MQLSVGPSVVCQPLQQKDHHKGSTPLIKATFKLGSTVPPPPQPSWLEKGFLKQHIKKALSSTSILTFLYDLDSFLRRIHDQGVLWIQASFPDWWYISLSKYRIDSFCSLSRTTVPSSWSRPEVKNGSVLYRICGIARADRERVDASLKGSTGERSGSWVKDGFLPPTCLQIVKKT